jgi:transcriptional regulator, merR family
MASLIKNAFDCSIDVFASIGYGYIKNTEFKNNLDKFGEGTAQYVCDTIQHYVSKEKN